MKIICAIIGLMFLMFAAFSLLTALALAFAPVMAMVIFVVLGIIFYSRSVQLDKSKPKS